MLFFFILPSCRQMKMVGFPMTGCRKKRKAVWEKRANELRGVRGREGDVSGAKGTDLEALCPEHWQWKGCSLIEGITGLWEAEPRMLMFLCLSLNENRRRGRPWIKGRDKEKIFCSRIKKIELLSPTVIWWCMPVAFGRLGHGHLWIFIYLRVNSKTLSQPAPFTPTPTVTGWV